MEAFAVVDNAGKTIYNREKIEWEVEEIDIKQKLDMALAYSKDVTKKDIAEKLGVTPSAFNQRLKTGKFTQAELAQIASVLDAEYISYFQFKDGTKI